MIHLSLHDAGIISGIFLVLLALFGLLRPAAIREALPRFPRSRSAGFILLTLAAVWSFWMLWTMEMGEFGTFRLPLQIFAPIAYFLVLRFVEEFLSVRALGILLLLAANPLLEAAFFRYETSRLFVTALAYLFIVLGLLWVMMPYRLRDEIRWLTETSGRWFSANLLILIYGVILLVCAFTQY